jgi:hypothetical protein
MSERGGTHIIALLTSPIGITPSFSPLLGSENRVKASLISFSSAPVMLCSFASLDCRALGAEEASACDVAPRFAGLTKLLAVILKLC